MVQFGQSVSCGSSAVAGSVGSVVQFVHTVCQFAVADQFYPSPVN